MGAPFAPAQSLSALQLFVQYDFAHVGPSQLAHRKPVVPIGQSFGVVQSPPSSLFLRPAGHAKRRSTLRAITT
jgi:polysaccharide pyruvyl transferase WcaK-like protein